MKFKDSLNSYIKKIGCSNKMLSEVSGVSAETVGRYRKGTRVPQKDSEHLRKLAEGMAVAARQQGLALSAEEILLEWKDAIGGAAEVEYEAYILNLKKMLSSLEINNSELAKSLKYDPSYISRILSGQRKPSEIHQFMEKVSRFIARRVAEKNNIQSLMRLTGCSYHDVINEPICIDVVSEWLISARSAVDHRPDMKRFLAKIENFDPDEYVQTIRFDKIRLAEPLYRPPSSKHYTGIKQMMESELDFMLSTVTSPSMEDVILYSDMPMLEMAKDAEFPQKWMLGMAMMLKKGLHLHIIHNVDRPIGEMMLGLESYIPMYMTGQISPYYLKVNNNSSFLHIIKVSGAAALSGEAIAGFHNEGRYYFTGNKAELPYYRKRAEQLLKKSYPLMEIYNAARQWEFMNYYQETAVKDDKRMILTHLPLFTLSEELLEKMISYHLLNKAEAGKVRSFVREEKERMEEFLKEHTLVMEIPYVTEKQFAEKPIAVCCPEIFLNGKLSYSYEDYLLHLRQTEKFAAAHPRCRMVKNPAPAFRNINITIANGKYVIVSKSNSPAIHFVIKHPKMVEAFENFDLMITE